jgi:membrane fusion protein (multidrug efflux system)
MPDSGSSSRSPADASAPDDTGSPRSSKATIVVLVVAVGVMAALAMPRLFASEAGSGGGPRQQQAMGVDAEVARVSPIVERLETSGTLRANESVDLTSEASGKVTSIRFEEGARVQAGQLLLTINDAELQAERQRLQYRLKLATDREQRQARLLEQGGVSQEEYDAVQNEVNVLRSELALTEARIEKTQVRAPFAGRVGLRNVSEGSYITPQTAITTLQDVDPIKLDLSVPEQYASRVAAGSEIQFTVRGSDSTHTGTVYAVEPQIDAETRTLRIRARTDNDGTLRPGAFANVTLRLGTIDDALTVPTVAVVPTLGGQRLYVVENDTAQTRNVTLGIRDAARVQITSGLSPGDTVIVSGIQNLRAGLPVSIEASSRKRDALQKDALQMDSLQMDSLEHDSLEQNSLKQDSLDEGSTHEYSVEEDH